MSAKIRHIDELAIYETGDVCMMFTKGELCAALEAIEFRAAASYDEDFLSVRRKFQSAYEDYCVESDTHLFH